MNIFSQNWQTYPYSPVNTLLSFPLDDGRHTTNTTTEWWYLNLHLIGAAPDYKKYDVMLCYFNKPTTQRIFNIAMPETGVFHTNVNQTPLALTSQTAYWGLTYFNLYPSIKDTSIWTYPIDSIPYRYYYHAINSTDNDALNIYVTSSRPPLNVGGNGYIPEGVEGDSSYYFSYTNMKVEGTIKFAGVTDTITSGIGWIDRQWGPFSIGTSSSYEWFSLQLDKPGITWGTPQTPSEFNMWQIYSDTNDVPYVPGLRFISGIYPDDSQDTTCNYIFERLSYWHDASTGKYFSSSWRLINPVRNITLDIIPTIPDQLVNVTAFKFWEGSTEIKGVIENKPVEGLGFAELVNGHTYLINTPSVPTGLTITSFADHNTINWNTSTAGTYPVGGYRVYRSASTNGYWKYLASTSALSYDDYSVSPDTLFYYTVTSFDNQTSTSASAYASPVLAGIKDISTENYFVNIYPNPAKNQITIDITNDMKGSHAVVELYSVEGKLIYNRQILKSKTQLDISGLPLGVYILKIADDNTIVMKRFAKE